MPENFGERNLQNLKELACLGALQLSGFNFAELVTAKINDWVSKDAMLELVPAGIYNGRKSIQEYVNFLYGPLFNIYDTLSHTQYYKVMSAESNQCVLFSTGINTATLNPETTKGGKAEVQVSARLHYDYTFAGSSASVSIKEAYIHYPEEYISWFFGDQLDTKQTRMFTCSVLEKYCPGVYKRNGFEGETGRDQCLETLRNLPLVEEFGNFRANSQSCRKYHSSFAAVNEDHCPHLSFYPLEDVNGQIKCQDISNTQRTYDDVFSKEIFKIIEAKAEDHFGEKVLFREIDSGSKSPELTGSPSVSPTVKKEIDELKNDECVDKPGEITLNTGSISSCQEIQFLEIKSEREMLCKATTIGLKLMTSRCPVACGRHACYSFVGSCKDTEKNKKFINLNSEKSCKTVNYLRTSEEGNKNAWYDRICSSYAQPIVNGKTTDISLGLELVQDRCPSACQNLKCTCGDNPISFVTDASYNSITGDRLEVMKERTCSSLYGIKEYLYRNVLCLLNVHAITPQFGQDSLKVFYLCPKACGFRKECFCRDSKKILPTPNYQTKTRNCKDASTYIPKHRNYWCDELKQPLFARSCPIQCGNSYCLEDAEDSKDTISLHGGLISTSCWLISKGDASFKDNACNAMEDDLQVRGHMLCPKACDGSII
eukprot:CAMPEP_0194327726 /NCGR_PEP_ID=MMETSP0171-20130528/42210_1 /TAXON_ID=218684 /ORGANISM="Corethron pennatum, Strain L29A3" /LENGTH=655 /DNA_ID=CAMNT_0039087765 /DNA_START=308 /DNA_END=2275 /DNA_ORIENTATION=+